MKILKGKWNGILYEGGFDDFSVNGSFYMEKEVLYKNNPIIESRKRLDMAYLLLKNPQMIETIQKNSACFFHGTNANALPSILKYGINSVDTSRENNIDVTTGEEWSRINGKRNFISLTDCFNVALSYANVGPNDNSTNALLNFGVLVGTSLKDMDDLKFSRVHSDIPEIGVVGNLPIQHVKFLAVPEDKVEFVKKMVGEKDIDVVSMDMRTMYFTSSFRDKRNLLELEEINENMELPKSPYPTYFKDDVKPLVNERKTSKIKEIFEALKAKIHTKTKQTDDKTISERG